MDTTDRVQPITLHTQAQGTVKFNGYLLSRANSQQTAHTHSTDFIIDAAPLPTTERDRSGRKTRCSACRWFEVNLYKRDDGFYVLHTIGRTIVPGEIEFGRIATTDSAYTVVELMTVRNGLSVFLPAPSALALSMASKDDKDIRDAYVNRAVV